MSSEHHACPECKGGEFWLMPDGRIICADSECYRPLGRWKPGEPDPLAAAPLHAGHLSGWGSQPWCHACQSRTVTWHCADRGCRVVSCLKCMAVTACTGGRLEIAALGVERI